tara:strand:+ start:51 stop:626 length:576 start_codon:yes stop_codon:yes gene_type:complete
MSLKSNLVEAKQLLDQTLNNSAIISTTERIVATLADLFSTNNKVLICGNGGSACDAMHFAEEFTGRFRKNRKALPAIALADAGHLTCVANDYGFDHVFQRGVEAYGSPGDMFIGLSTSGNSNNVALALEEAKNKRMITVILTANDGGKLKNKADFEILVPGKTADRIQELHMLLLHTIIEYVERHLFPDLY